MDAQRRALERRVRLGDGEAAQELVRAFERCGMGDNAAWRWHVSNVESQVATWGEERAQGHLSLALFGLFLDRYGVDTLASGRLCPRRVAGLEHLPSRCVCSGEGWTDHARMFGRGSENPVVLTSQPYREPDGRRWASVKSFCARSGVSVDVFADSESWHNPGFSRLIVLSRPLPQSDEARRSRRRLVEA